VINCDKHSKGNFSRGKITGSPPEQNARFVCRMESVLQVYPATVSSPPKHPVVCLDETTKQLVKRTGRPVAVKPGQPRQQTISMNATVQLIYSCYMTPCRGWRHIELQSDCSGLCTSCKDLSRYLSLQLLAEITVVQEIILNAHSSLILSTKLFGPAGHSVFSTVLRVCHLQSMVAGSTWQR